MGGLDRRQFLRHATAWSAGALLLGRGSGAPAAQEAAAPAADAAKRVELRALGTTGRTLPRLGLGCYPLGAVAADAAAIRVVERAHELGVRYFDTAPSYSNGRSEARVGRALKGVKRDELWLATKTLERKAGGARRELEASLARLGVDYVDSIQCHEIHDDWETLFAKGSALAALEQAQEEKLVRHIGITCHRNPRYALEAIRRHPFATALVPVNPLDVQYLSFTRDFLPVAAEKKVAVIAMKLFAGGKLVNEQILPARDCLTWALARPEVDVIVPGCETVAHVEEAYAVAAGFQRPGDDALRDIERRAGKHEGVATEWYKSG